MKLHDWQDQQTMNKALDVAKKSLRAGASEESAKRAGAMVIDRLMAERRYEADVQQLMRERGCGRGQAERHHEYVYGSREKFVARLIKEMNNANAS